jgi:Family of unknown function (DUF5906)
MESQNPNLSHLKFGTATKRFECDTLATLVSSGQIDKAKEYLIQYFCIASNNVVFYYNSYLKELAMLSDVDAKKLYIKKDYEYRYYQNNKPEIFSIQKWFFNSFGRVVEQDIRVDKPLAYIEDEIPFVNHFSGYLHSKRPEKMSEFASKGVSKVWKHIQEVWCSSNDDLFAYVQKWIACMVSGRKMESCLYLKSGQGTGKSIVTEFIEAYVLGRNLVHITKDTKCIDGGFNGELYGKTLLVLEELPTDSAREWRNISNSLKNYVTGSTIEIEFKGKDKFTLKNILSIIIMSNNNALRIDTDDRRIVMLDISNKYKGNEKYFSGLLQYTLDKSVGEAFYWDCVDRLKGLTSFNEGIIPFTQNKKDLIVDNLHSLYDFLKLAFIKKNRGLYLPFSEFYDKYSSYCEDKKLKVESKISVSKLLSNINITVSIMGNNQKHLIVDKKVLKETFMSRNWIHDLDDIEVEAPKKKKKVEPVKEPEPEPEEEDEEDEDEDDIEASLKIIF